MKIYTEPNAYDTISRDVENNFHTYINKSSNEIKTIVIVGGFICYEGDTFLKNYPNSIIHIFEPVQEFFSVLIQKYQHNPRVKLYNIAITNKIGTIDFYRTSSPGSDSIYPVLKDNNSGYKFNNTQKITVQTNKLSNIIDDNIDLLSIDVQGAELEVLRGTNLEKVSCIFAEVQLSENKHNQVYDGQCFMDDLTNFLSDKFDLHSLGLDNELNNGTGNSFWIKNK